jgi:hypothetical protein
MNDITEQIVLRYATRWPNSGEELVQLGLIKSAASGNERIIRILMKDEVYYRITKEDFINIGKKLNPSTVNLILKAIKDKKITVAESRVLNLAKQGQDWAMQAMLRRPHLFSKTNFRELYTVAAPE